MRWKDRLKAFTLVIIPHGGGRSRALSLPPWLLMCLLLGIGAVVAAGAVFVKRHASLAREVQEWRRQQVVYKRQNAEMAAMAKKAEDLDQRLRQLEELDQRVRGLLREKEPALLPPGAAGGGASAAPQRAVPDPGGDRRGDPLVAARVRLDAAARRVEAAERSLEALWQDLSLRAEVLEAIPSIPPVRSGISSGFGWRISPFGYREEFHRGLDMPAPYGTRVVATAEGVVTFAGWNGEYGRMVVIRHRYGFQTVYGHHSRLAVREGERVRQGQVIGYVGSSGRSSGPHVHYEVWEGGRPVNPALYLNLKMSTVTRLRAWSRAAREQGWVATAAGAAGGSRKPVPE